MFFHRKATIIKELIKPIKPNLSVKSTILFYLRPLKQWSSVADILPVDDDDGCCLLKLMPAKLSLMDKVPTSILKSCSTVFAPIIARLANLSFAGVVPSSFKLACVSSLLKKPGLTCDYRSISNLNTISKVLERLFLSAEAPTRLCVNELQPSSIRLPTCEFNGNSVIKIPK